MFGISQDPITKNYIMVFEYYYLVSKCKQCYNKYTNMYYSWCKPCEINNLKKNFTKWTSGNKQIDSFIQERQLEVDYYNKLVFEWIPYNQFNDVKGLGKSDLTSIYSAVWRNGPLYYDYHNKKEWKRESYKKVVLKYFLQNLVDELLNEVRNFFINILILIIVIFFKYFDRLNYYFQTSIFLEYLRIQLLKIIF